MLPELNLHCVRQTDWGYTTSVRLNKPLVSQASAGVGAPGHKLLNRTSRIEWKTAPGSHTEAMPATTINHPSACVTVILRGRPPPPLLLPSSSPPPPLLLPSSSPPPPLLLPSSSPPPPLLLPSSSPPPPLLLPSSSSCSSSCSSSSSLPSSS